MDFTELQSRLLDEVDREINESREAQNVPLAVSALSKVLNRFGTSTEGARQPDEYGPPPIPLTRAASRPCTVRHMEHCIASPDYPKSDPFGYGYCINIAGVEDTRSLSVGSPLPVLNRSESGSEVVPYRSNTQLNDLGQQRRLRPPF